jgi:hypothetical protein
LKQSMASLQRGSLLIFMPRGTRRAARRPARAHKRPLVVQREADTAGRFRAAGG